MKELARRLWHIFGGLCIPASALLVAENIFLPALISITIAAAGVRSLICVIMV